jgi:hypothetical protein
MNNLVLWQSWPTHDYSWLLMTFSWLLKCSWPSHDSTPFHSLSVLPFFWYCWRFACTNFPIRVRILCDAAGKQCVRGRNYIAFPCWAHVQPDGPGVSTTIETPRTHCLPAASHNIRTRIGKFVQSKRQQYQKKGNTDREWKGVESWEGHEHLSSHKNVMSSHE